MVSKEYRTAAALFTVAMQRLGDCACPVLVASILCKRAECLLHMVSVANKRIYFPLCQLAKHCCSKFPIFLVPSKLVACEP